MNSKINELIKRDKDEQDERVVRGLKKTFRKVLEVYIDKNYPNGLECDNLMCSIHSYFTSGHNCVACNLNMANKRIEKYLLQYKNFNDVNLTFTNFIFLLYLQVECIYEYFHQVELDDTFKNKNLKVFQEIKWWANFLKHPKAFMLVHHPIWAYRGMQYSSDQYNYDRIEKAKEQKEIIDTGVVEKFYKGKDNNFELYNLLTKKEDMVVLFPDPIDLMKRYTEAQERFILEISENEVVRNILESKATIEYHLNEDNEKRL